ncbi:MAG: protein phosphatase CheZ [Gammaproteobacteria bacterium]|nr:protein phosphatase CheZ [Gammaproteobacteria bacterium]
MTNQNNNYFLEQAKLLVQQLESGDEVGAARSMDALSPLQESHLFQELGKLTRELHSTLNNFQLDSRIAGLTEKDIPDAKERLNYVIVMTQQAADRTLTSIEKLQPLTDELGSRSNALQKEWDRFQRRDMQVEEFRKLSKELETYFQWLGENVPAIQGNISDIMMAQDFQDLTGQIIKRVINLVQEVEGSLVELIRITGSQIVKPVETSNERDITAQGPAVPGIDKGVVKGQDDVDDLLSSLGF